MTQLNRLKIIILHTSLYFFSVHKKNADVASNPLSLMYLCQFILILDSVSSVFYFRPWQCFVNKSGSYPVAICFVLIKIQGCG